MRYIYSARLWISGIYRSYVGVQSVIDVAYLDIFA